MTNITQKFSILLFWVISIIFSPLYAQFSCDLKNYSLKHGLSQSTVYAIVQDQTGYLWTGTRDGLNRFDGYSFKTYQIKGSNTLMGERTIRALLTGPDNSLWIGTDGAGPVLFEPSSESYTSICELRNFQDCSYNLNILSMAYSDSVLWAGTRENGVLRYDLRSEKISKYLGEETVWSIALTDHGTTYAGTGERLYSIPKNGGEEVLASGLSVKSIFLDDQNQIWVGTETSGVKLFKQYDKETKSSSYDVLEELDTEFVQAISSDAKGRIWIGTKERGAFIFNPTDFSLNPIQEVNIRNVPFSENSIRSIYTDRSGVTWIGTNTSGVFNYSPYRSVFSSSKKAAISQNISLQGEVVLGFESLIASKIIVGTENNGLFIYDTSDHQSKKVDFLSETTIVTLLKDSKGNLWIGSDGEGLYKLEKNDIPDFTKAKSIHGLSNTSVLSLAELDHQTILAGTYKGLNRVVNNEVKEQFYAEPGKSGKLQDDRILSLMPDSKGNFWVGTHAGGLSFYNAEQSNFRTYQANPNDTSGISSNRINAIFRNNDSDVWLATYNGLNHLDRDTQKFQAFQRSEGLPSSVVYGIIADDQGKLWLSTNNGVSTFDPKRNRFKNYSEEDGLQGNEFNGGAYFKDADGTIYFGGINGFNGFHPDSLLVNTYKPNTAITSFSVNGEQRSITNVADHFMDYLDNYLLFEFASFDFSKPEKHQFRYKLEGFGNNNWINIGQNRSVNFSGLQPGAYKFIAQGTNGDGVWGHPSEPITFEIYPPFWKTSIFRISIFLFFGLILYVAYRYRMYYLLREEKTRNQIARDLHDDLSGTLSSISFFSNAAQRPRNSIKDARVFLQKIDESAAEAKEKINDIIWAIDPSKDDWSTFLKKCTRYASDALDAREIRYEIDIDDSFKPQIKLELRQNLWLIYKEIINNLVEHSQANYAWIKFKEQGGKIRLWVKDDGVGIDQSEEMEGHGIKNIQKRAEMIGAEVHLTTEPRKGTEWNLVLKS